MTRRRGRKEPISRHRRADAAHRGAQHAANRIRAAQRSVRGLDAAMQRPRMYRHPAGRIVRIETHISVVYLAGRFAYKIIKPVAPGFADFTAAETRRRCCEAQVRLNRPLARALYLGVLPIARHAGRLQFGASGAAIEHAVKMRRFDEATLFSTLAKHSALTPRDIDDAAQRLADYHRHAPRNVPVSRYGSAALLRAQVEAVNASLLANVSHPALHEIAAWCAQQLDKHASALDRRRVDGFVRGCHGDLHLDNVVRWHSRIAMFDCIDFDDALRWIDVANDVAFLVMDLRARAGARLANRLLNGWLEVSGDYSALAPMPLYVVYRALVRAWVAHLKGRNASARRAANAALDTQRYIEVACAEIRRPGPVLLLCHGYSGSGKSVASRALAELSSAVHLSSDIERKRLISLRASNDRLGVEHYTHMARDAIYDHLLRLASDVLRHGNSAIVDATFIMCIHRSAFVALAERLRVPVLILDFHAEPSVLIERIEARNRGPRDASDADVSTLTLQLASADPLTDDEKALTFTFDTAVPLASFDSTAYWQPVIELMQRAAEPAEPSAQAC
ncbi:AAA family ATPase [Paraburkholderia sp. CNPSo 3157]|uniref:AAA family ATPase n=1 Tax=Paraburkholderia franconis TaxID=2654983 RepID=A0A7X1TK34_9BURK|nr:bifunctional aminoglycoside phosphotransferase/ATP-binding protein [Paraburkholderia franconis]MPW21989.1 AAA family ATPase [Paraburkholderia franconis]